MRGKRAKQYRKLMKQYGITFGFREPYQVLVDAQMVQDLNRFTMAMPRAFERTLSGGVKPMITQCSMRHLYSLPAPASTDKTTTAPSAEQRHKESCIAMAKNMERRRCNHHLLDEPLSTLECLSSIIDSKSTHTKKDLVNKFNYVVAAQDPELREWCRGVRGVPMISVHRSVMMMEPMAQGSQQIREREERGKMRREILGKRERAKDDDTEDEADEETLNEGTESRIVKKKRRRGPKGPNPLSVLKPKKEKVSQKQDAEQNSTTEARDILIVNGDGPKKHAAARKRRRRHKSKGTTQDGDEDSS